MKGDTEIMEIVFGTIVFVGLVLFFVFFISSTMKEFRGGVKTSIEDLEVVEAAHLIENCFSEKSNANGKITQEFLSENNLKPVAEICDIQYPQIFVEISDIESEDKWSFSPKELSVPLKNKNHYIWVPILKKGRLVTGKGDIVMKAGKIYVLDSEIVGKPEIGVQNPYIIVYIYPSEIYKSAEDKIDEFTIQRNNLEDLKNRIYRGGKLRIYFGNDFTQDIKAEDLIPSTFSLGKKISDCSGRGEEDICILIFDKEKTTMGRLHVTI